MKTFDEWYSATYGPGGVPKSLLAEVWSACAAEHAGEVERLRAELADLKDAANSFRVDDRIQRSRQPIIRGRILEMNGNVARVQWDDGCRSDTSAYLLQAERGNPEDTAIDSLRPTFEPKREDAFSEAKLRDICAKLGEPLEFRHGRPVVSPAMAEMIEPPFPPESNL